MKKKAELSNISFFIDYITNFMKKVGFSQSAILDIVLASEEILVNIGSYAYPKKPGSVSVLCDFDKN